MSLRAEQGLIVEGYAPSQMIEDLRKYQAELEVQNKALRYSQQEAEGASERFATLAEAKAGVSLFLANRPDAMPEDAKASSLYAASISE